MCCSPTHNTRKITHIQTKQKPTKTTQKKLGGIELLLANTQLDEAAPVAKEWALWGVRNLCLGSAAARAHFGGLQALSDPVTSPELQRMGQEVRVDRATGRMRLVPAGSGGGGGGDGEGGVGDGAGGSSGGG